MLRNGASMMAVAVVALWMTGPAVAEDPDVGVKVDAREGQVSVQVDANRDKASQGISLRATEIQGMAIRNEEGKELGSVEDVVINVRAGQVKYAALSYGGFLGVGDKLFAVPWHALEYRTTTDGDEQYLMLDIREETLKSAPGFDQDKWPNFADKRLVYDIETHYRAEADEQPRAQDAERQTRREQRRTDRGRSARVEVEADEDRVAVQAGRDREARKSTPASGDIVQRANDIIGMTVKNPANKELGSVTDVVIDVDTGKTRYAALSFGGVLGVGDKLFAVPWRAFDCQYDAASEEYFLLLAVDEATLRNAPGFEQDNWPERGDEKFNTEVDNHFDKARPETRQGEDPAQEADPQRSNAGEPFDR